MTEPNGDAKTQYCPRCGAINFAGPVVVSKCSLCTWRIKWVGPLWGQV